MRRWTTLFAVAVVAVAGFGLRAEAQESPSDARSSSTPALGLEGVERTLSAAPTIPAAAPAPHPALGGPPNIFYGGVPPVPVFPARSTVLVFLHGLHGNAFNWWVNNNMYDIAFQSGFRTAFISMNADNSQNDDGFLDNGEKLKTFLPIIAQHYQTEKVVLIGHSMGGLDAQAALMDPEVRRLVSAVFTISTPNTGTELADWAFGPGFDLAAGLGLLTPGVYSLQTENVAMFRTLADPILQASGIPFFTLEGSSSVGPITGAMGLILAGLAPGQKNDGFVTVPRGRLPAEWSTDIGEVKTNHFDVDSGDETFTKIHGRLMALEYTLRQFDKIVANGFGDVHNTWLWSMQWFQGKLYVGTGREIQCLSYLTSDVQSGTNLYPGYVLSGECPEGTELSQAIAAEIWTYDPGTRDWQRVFKSPESIFLGVVDGQALFTARDVGFRGMTVFTEPDGTEALYVGGVTSGSVYEKAPQFAANGYPPPRLLRSVDGVNFAAVPQAPGTFLGEIGNPLPGSQRALRSFRALTAYNGKLFATVGNFTGVGVVVASANPQLGNNAWFLASPVTEQMPVWNLITFNNFLYATTGDSQLSDDGFGLYKTAAAGAPPYTWQPVIVSGAGQQNPTFRAPNGLSFAIFHGQLYLGTNRPTELYRVNPDDSWDLLVGEPRLTAHGLKTPLSGMGNGFGNWFNGHFWRMAEHQGQLYLTTWDWSVGLKNLDALDKLFAFQYGFDFFRTADGIKWESVTRSGFLDAMNSGGRSIVSTEAGLFVGTEGSRGGADVYLCAPPDCTADEPPASLPAPHDLVAAPEVLVDREVALSWEPSPGALRYRIYRATVRPLMEFLPPGLEIPIPELGIVLTLGGILAGDYDFICELPPVPTTMTLCDIITAVKNIQVGLPLPFLQVGITLAPHYAEAAPTNLQSIYFVRAEDSEGNLSTPSNFVGAPSKWVPGTGDTDPPNVVAVLSPPPNAAGWNNSDVTVSWAITTPGAGLAAAVGCDTVTLAGEGPTTLTCAATNSSGQTTISAVQVRIDKTPPAISGQASPAPNGFGWNKTDVTVAFTCSDSVSAVAQCGATQVVQDEGAGQSRTGVAVDLAGNTATATVGGINIDKTPPTVVATSNPAPNENGWNNTDVTVSFSPSDALSGIDTVTPPVTLTGEGAGQVVNGIAVDRAGNSASTSLTVNIDKTAPEAVLEPDAVAANLVARGQDVLSGVVAGAIGPDVAVVNGRQSYRVVDRAGNTLVLGVIMRRTLRDLDARVETLRYNNGPTRSLPANQSKASWVLGTNNSLQQLEQELRDAPPPSGHHARSKFSAVLNTTLVLEGSGSGNQVSMPGLHLLQLGTQGGGLLVIVH